MRDEEARRLSINFSHIFTTRVVAAVEYSTAYSVYSPMVSISELTTAQSLVLSVFHSLLREDVASVVTLLSFADHFPQLRSSFIGVWLRDDYRFQQEDVAKVLITLARLMTEGQVVVPLTVVSALTGLEEKYDIFNFLRQSDETTALYLLACLNPLVTRATQAGPTSVQDQGVEAKPTMVSAASQTSNKDCCTEAKLPRMDLVCKPTGSEVQASMLIAKRSRHGSPPRHIRGQPSTLNVDEPSCSRSPSPQRHDMVDQISQSSSPFRLDAERKLLAAARNNDFEAASRALAAGARPDCRDRWDWTPLHLAAERGCCRMVSLLLAAGAAVDSVTVGNATALHYAASSGHLDCSLKLLNSQADPNAMNSWGFTPLHKALQHRHHIVADLLKSRGGHIAR